MLQADRRPQFRGSATGSDDLFDVHDGECRLVRQFASSLIVGRFDPSFLAMVEYADMSTPSTLGARIRTLRKERKEAQAVVAEAIGIERPTLTGIELGTAMPGRETLAALATYFNVSRDYLETGAPPVGTNIPDGGLQDREYRALLDLWGMLAEDQQRVIVDLMRTMAKRPSQPENIAHTPASNVNTP